MLDISLDGVTRELKEIISQLQPGEMASVFENGKRAAVIRRDAEEDFSCTAGSASGKILYMANDFDAPLNDFSEYSM